MMKYSYFLLLLLPVTSAFSQRDSLRQQDSIKYHFPEITVSATRAEEPVLEVPLAVSTIELGSLISGRSEGLNDALRTVPGVIAQTRTGGSDVRLTIRGFGARGAGERSNAGTSRGIRILVDGIPETEPDGRTAFDMIDLQAARRIDIVRSNASALYGSAAGGIVNIHSNSSFTAPFIEAGATLGGFGYRRTSLSFGSILGEGSRLFGTLSMSSSTGWRAHSDGSRTVVSVGMKSELAGGSRLGVFLNGVSSLYHIPGALTLVQYEADSYQANAKMVARNERRSVKQGKIGFTLERDFSEQQSLWLMAYATPKALQRSERGTFRDFTRYHVGGSGMYTWRTGLSENMRNQLVLGFDESYQDGAQLFYTLTSSGGRGDSVTQNKREAAHNFGIFLQDEVHVAENLHLLLGLRYDVQRYIYQNFRTASEDAGLTFESLTPRIALSYQFTPTRTVYANIGRGLETPAFNEVDPPPDSMIIAAGGTPGAGLNPLLTPARSVTYEIGTKGVFSPGSFITSLSYDVASYAITITNDIIPWAGGAYYFTAGRSRRYGIEGGIGMQTAMNLSLTASATAMDAKYIEYRSSFGAFNGNTTAGIPPLALNFHARYAFNGGTHFDLSMEHLGSYYADDANLVDIPAYTVAHLSAGTAMQAGSFLMKFTAGVSNITDTKYIGSVYINPEKTSAGYTAFEPGMPRSLFFSLSVGM